MRAPDSVRAAFARSTRSLAGRDTPRTKSAPSSRESKAGERILLPTDRENPGSLGSNIQVFERDWLSSNNVLLHGGAGAALVDSGYGAHVAQTLALIEHALEGTRLARLVNTHCHSDHMGGNRALQDAHFCRTTIPAGEAPLIDRWDEDALYLGFADQRAPRFRYDDTLAPGDVVRLGEIDWQAIAAPGHDPNAIMLYAPDERILISGDALWEDGFGVIFPALFGRLEALSETRATLESIGKRDVRAVIPGHGPVFTGVSAALERAFRRLEGFELDPLRLARHAAKVMIVFALLEKRRMAVEDLPRYVATVGILRELNARWFNLTPPDYADWLVTELERAGALKRDSGDLVPLMRA
jgi:glyoxylase-like metal-dependent hydrolase (beta-lactamase superfamily II)